MPKTSVKICCISSVKEAEMAIKYGASTLGLVGHMPSGPGVIDDGLIHQIVQQIPASISTFLLTSETKPLEIIKHYKRTLTSTIQIVDAVDQSAYQAIRIALPEVQLVQVIHVLNEHSIQEAKAIAPFVDAILLDSGNPNLKVKELGGTGRMHNWAISTEIRKAISIPVYLAGGINADNVRAAIETVQPYGIDLCSSVRSNGKLDKQKLKAFFKALEF